MIREVRFEPGYDHRAEPRGGCHGLTIRFLLRGEEGVVQFVMYTDWMPTDVVPGRWGPRVDRHGKISHQICDLMPMAADLGYHWPSRRYEDQISYDCHLLPGGKCFYDGSGLNAERLMADLFTEGHEAVWTRLEDYYAELQKCEAPNPAIHHRDDG